MKITELNKKDEVYSDFQSSFVMHPMKKNLATDINEDAVKSSLINIIKTNHYERKFRPLFGANLARYLFEPLTSITLDVVRQDVINAITEFEPRAEIIEVIASGGQDENTLNITIIFSILNRLEPLTVNVALSRVR